MMIKIFPTFLVFFHFFLLFFDEEAAFVVETQSLLRFSEFFTESLAF